MTDEEKYNEMVSEVIKSVIYHRYDSKVYNLEGLTELATDACLSDKHYGNFIDDITGYVSDWLSDEHGIEY